MTRDEAFLYVKARRPAISPNPGFWDQLLVFEGQCHQSGDNDPSLPAQVDMIFDASWAQKSNAHFASCHQILEFLMNSKHFQCLSSATIQESREHVLSLCLDYIWGRGVLDVDLDWLLYVCQVLDDDDQTKASSSSSAAEAAPNLSSATDTVEGTLRNNESVFWNVWAGEIYEPQIQKVLSKLKVTRSLDP